MAFIEPCFGIGHNLSLICQMTSEDIKHQLIIIIKTELAWALGVLPQLYQYPNLSEGVDRVAGQLRGDKECPFNGVTKSDRVWRKVPESGARECGR